MLVTFQKGPSLFDQALEAHRGGRLADADRLYREILRQDPRHADSLHMIALLKHQAGQSQEAVALLEQLAQANPQLASICSNLAEVKRSLGQLEPAIEWCRKAISIQPTLAAAHQNLATILNQLGRYQESLGVAMRAIELAPKEAVGYTAAGCALLELGRLNEAVRYLEESVKYAPNDASVNSALGCAQERLEMYEKALASQKRAIELSPKDLRIQLNMGALLLRMERFPDARDWFQKMLLESPGLRVAREQMAGIHLALKEFDQSIALCHELLAERPEGVEVFATLGEAMMSKGNFEECISVMRQSLAKRPFPSTYQTLSNALVRNGHPAEGLAELEHALALAPQDPILHFNKSIILMLMGRYAEAWPEYESRWKHPRMVGRNRAFNRPRWEGEPLNGKRILLHAEQGMGDTLFFGRYIPRVAERGGKVVVFCQDAMVSLVKGIEGVVEVVGENKPLPPFDAHVPIMSLPGVFGTTLDNLPEQFPPTFFPFIKPDPVKNAFWKAELARLTSKLKIGLVWEGGAFQPENFLRSNSLAAYAPLADVPGVTFFGLQKGPAEVQAKNPPPGMDFINLASHLKDFSDTAAILDNLDLLISIDTSVVHVAGALNKPVWMLLAYSPGHMWMFNCLDSPWYPMFKIYRQTAFQDWVTPMAKVKADLEKWVREKTANAGQV